MIRIGQNEFAIPSWLGTTVPVAFGLYATLLLTPDRYSDFGAADSNYFFYVRQIATAAIAGFLLIDLVQRSAVAWYALPLIYPLSWAVATVATDWIYAGVGNVSIMSLGLAFALVASPRGAGTGGAVAVYAAMLVLPLVMGAVVALILTMGGRLLAALPLTGRETLRDLQANLAASVLWTMLALGGGLAIRLWYGGSGSQYSAWLAYSTAIAAALVATIAHLLLVRRMRRSTADRNSFRLWAAALLCVAILFYSPYAFGRFGVRALYDYVRPTLRAVHLLPTPPLTLVGYTVDVPFHDLNTIVGKAMPDGSASNVIVPLPTEYGLKVGPVGIEVTIYRRDIPLQPIAYLWLDQSKALKSIQDKAPDRDATTFTPSPGPMLAMRSTDYPDVDFLLAGFDPSTTQDMAEQALRRFLHRTS